MKFAFAWRTNELQQYKMPNPDFRAAILIVSTTASKDRSTDASTEALRDVFENEERGTWEVSDVKIVGDEMLEIQRSIMAWADAENPVNLIVTAGGTGFSVNDVTPEVCEQQLGLEMCIICS
jgi:gephyrin